MGCFTALNYTNKKQITLKGAGKVQAPLVSLFQAVPGVKPRLPHK